MSVEKLCRKCCVVRPATEFRPNAKLRDGLHSWCRECMRQAVRASRAKHGAKYNADRRAELRGRGAFRWVERGSDEEAYLLAVARDPCAYCGDPATELDHIVAGLDEVDNLTAACRSCNARKRNMSLLGWMLRQGLIAEGFYTIREEWDRAGAIAA